MVAPNGARRGKADHPRLPLSLAEIVETAAACAHAGADAIHAHVRDGYGRHCLDAGLYRELLDELTAATPSLAVQITTESVGQYPPQQQRQLLYDLRPPWASVSLAEMLSDGDTRSARRLYHWAAAEQVRLQHILYSPPEVRRLAQCLADEVVPRQNLQVLFVLGRYHPATDGVPSMLDDFLAAREALSPSVDFMVCAFGKQETACLRAAVAAGGDCRVGFENNLWHEDGSLAADNAERVAAIKALFTED